MPLPKSVDMENKIEEGEFFKPPTIDKSKARFLIADEEGMFTDGAWEIYQNGHDVRFLSIKPEGKEHLLNMVPHVSSLEEGLEWVGKDGYIIFGDEADLSSIRKRGYKAYGGNAFTNKIEKDRNFQNKIVTEAGIKAPNAHAVESIDEAIAFIKEKPDQYVLKQMGHAPKSWNFVGKEEDGSDVIDQLEWMKKQIPWMKETKQWSNIEKKMPFMLQEFVDGLEFGVAAIWMYNDWKRRDDGSIFIENNREHKKAGDGDTQQTCGESGTAILYTDHDKFFNEVLNKMTPILKKECSDVVINVDANCGLADEGGKIVPYLYEITARTGYPACALLHHLLETDVAQFYMDIIDGKQGNIEHSNEWGIVTVMGSGRYPLEFSEGNIEGSFKDQPVKIPQWDSFIDPDIRPAYIKWDAKSGLFRISDFYEYILMVTKSGPSIEQASHQCVLEMKKIVTRAPHYRFDIGLKFEREELPILREWGFAPK